MLVLILCVVLLLITENHGDNPCLQRRIESQSIVCVCNETYCDTLSREQPKHDVYLAYTSSEEGLRFSKSSGYLNVFNMSTYDGCSVTLELDTDTKYQTVQGFGGAITDAAGINWKNLSNTLQKYLIDSYFSDNGLQYNMIRVPIGGSDFSTHPYAYNDLPENDTTLSNFTLSYEDYHYKIPMIKSALTTSKRRIDIVATTWSPPPWMKTNHKYSGISRLKPEYYQTYAEYHRKFIEKYANEGINVSAITTTNEPSSGALGLDNFNTLGWNVKEMGEWIVNNLGPTIRNSTYKNVKILAVDDQRITIPYWFNMMVTENPKTLDYIDGVAVHYYTDMISPATLLSEIPEQYPKLFVISTEACEGSFPWQKNKVELGSWSRARNYMSDIINDLNHKVVAWIDWNICLNVHGGPNWAKNFVDSPIIVFPEKREFVKQPMFYAIGHFSKFIPRGSRRIRVIEKKHFFQRSVENVAFITENSIVMVLHNSGHATSVNIKLGKKNAVIRLKANSFTTVELPYSK